jgi:thiamine-monophosphate kinase
MPLGEFELIDRHFRRLGARRADVVLGVGDDGAILRPPTGSDLVAVSDTLVEGVHFPAGSPPRSIGHRSLAVNLSDIAAMGAIAAWALLNLTLPHTEEDWLAEFAAGFEALALEHEVALVGGDTTRGPLMVSVQVLGFVPHGQGLRRSRAQAGDLLCVSGTPGDAAAGLRLLQAARTAEVIGAEALGGTEGRAGIETRDGARTVDPRGLLRRRFEYPTPRLALGRDLAGLASACIDVSDGLMGDVGKIATASGCGAILDLDLLPRSAALAAMVHDGTFSDREALRFALGGGDDYELAFAVPRARQAELDALPRRHEVTIVGEFVDGPEAAGGARVSLRSAGLSRSDVAAEVSAGFDHFGA